MNKKTDMILITTTIICLIPIILGIILYDQLPEQIPIHFDSAGNPDNYLSKVLTVFGLPVLLALLNVYSHFRLNIDPKAENASFNIKQALKWAVPLISIIAIPLSLFISMGVQIPIVMVISAIAGLVVIICGNYLPKCRQNYTVGYKLPWTLDSEDNWKKTHRFAGFVWVIGGLTMIISAFFTTWYLNLIVIILLVVLPAAYSYLKYRAA